MVSIPLSHQPGYRFGPFGLKSDGTLLVDKGFVHVPPKELQVLRVLLSRPGQLIDQDTLIDLAWKGGDVACESLTRCIYSLRKILGAHKHYIATVYGKGYRFEGPVIEVGAEWRAAPRLLSVSNQPCRRVPARPGKPAKRTYFKTLVQVAMKINAQGQGRFGLRIIRSGLHLYTSLILPASGACAPFPSDRRRLEHARHATTDPRTAPAQWPAAGQ